MWPDGPLLRQRMHVGAWRPVDSMVPIVYWGAAQSADGASIRYQKGSMYYSRYRCSELGKRVRLRPTNVNASRFRIMRVFHTDDA